MKPPGATLVRLIEEFKIKFGVQPNAVLVSNCDSALLKLGRIHGLPIYEAPSLPVDLSVALIHPHNPQ